MEGSDKEGGTLVGNHSIFASSQGNQGSEHEEQVPGERYLVGQLCDVDATFTSPGQRHIHLELGAADHSSLHLLANLQGLTLEDWSLVTFGSRLFRKDPRSGCTRVYRSSHAVL